jgi:hypothetical protein
MKKRGEEDKGKIERCWRKKNLSLSSHGTKRMSKG